MTRPLSAADRQRLRSTGNLWRALIPLVAVVAIVVALTWPSSTVSDGVHPIELAGPISAARQQAGFTLVVASVTAPAWRATSTNFTAPQGSTAASFRVGYVSPTGKYLEFFQSNDSADAVSALYGPLTYANPVTVNSAKWDGFQTGSNRELIRHSFVEPTGGPVTVIITGSASNAEMVAFAASVS